MMRAAIYTRTGPAADVLVVTEVPIPTPASAEVLVRIAASGINPADVKRRGGWNGARMAHPMVIPHCDGAGVIEAVGSDVDKTRVGERVWLWNAQGGYGEAGRAFGTAAEYIALPAEQAVRLPDALDFDSGACLGVPGLTSWLAVMGDGPVSGKTVLVQGAAGAVGQMCVQMALAHGAMVIGSVSDEEGAKTVQSYGPVQTINRHKENVAETVRELTRAKGADRIVEVDLAANFQVDIDCLAPHGVIASYSSSSDPSPSLPYYSLADLGATIRFIQGFRLPDAQRRTAEKVIVDLISKKKLRAQIGARFPLIEISTAHERVEAGAPGQTVLTLTSPDRR